MATETRIEQNLLVDLRFEGDLQVTKTGDLDTISGFDNLRQRLYHRLITVPGSLAHRPEYGVGVKEFQNEVGSLDKQRNLAFRIQDQFEQDPGLEKVRSIAIRQQDSEPGEFKVIVRYKPVGRNELDEEFDPFKQDLI